MADAPEVPHHDMAEENVVGSILKSRGASMAKLVSVLKAEAFYNHKYRDIYRAAVSLYSRDVPVEYSTLDRELSAMHASATLADLTGVELNTPSAAHAEHYAVIINEMDVRRRLISAHQTGVELAWDTANELSYVVSRSEAAFMAAVRASTGGDRSHSLEESAEAFAQSILSGKSTSMVGKSSPWRAMNRITLGLEKQNVYLLAARTQVGKSIIIEQLAIHFAQNHGPVYLASLEMGDRKIIQRGTAMLTGLPRKRILLNDLAPYEREQVAAAARAVGALPIRIWTGPASIEKITSAALRYQSDVGQMSLCLVDYIQLLTCDERVGNREQEVSAVSRMVKSLAERLDTPVFAAAQVSRASTQRGDPIPELTDLRESGSLEQDADYVLALHRDDPQTPPGKMTYPGQAVLVSLKDRDTGNAGMRLKLSWNFAGELYTDPDGTRLLTQDVAAPHSDDEDA